MLPLVRRAGKRLGFDPGCGDSQGRANSSGGFAREIAMYGDASKPPEACANAALTRCRCGLLKLRWRDGGRGIYGEKLAEVGPAKRAMSCWGSGLKCAAGRLLPHECTAAILM